MRSLVFALFVVAAQVCNVYANSDAVHMGADTPRRELAGGLLESFVPKKKTVRAPVQAKGVVFEDLVPGSSSAAGDSADASASRRSVAASAPKPKAATSAVEEFVPTAAKKVDSSSSSSSTTSTSTATSAAAAAAKAKDMPVLQDLTPTSTSSTVKKTVTATPAATAAASKASTPVLEDLNPTTSTVKKPATTTTSSSSASKQAPVLEELNTASLAKKPTVAATPASTTAAATAAKAKDMPVLQDLTPTSTSSTVKKTATAAPAATAAASKASTPVLEDLAPSTSTAAKKPAAPSTSATTSTKPKEAGSLQEFNPASSTAAKKPATAPVTSSTTATTAAAKTPVLEDLNPTSSTAKKPVATSAASTTPVATKPKDTPVLEDLNPSATAKKPVATASTTTTTTSAAAAKPATVVLEDLVSAPASASAAKSSSTAKPATAAKTAALEDFTVSAPAKTSSPVATADSSATKPKSTPVLEDLNPSTSVKKPTSTTATQEVAPAAKATEVLEELNTSKKPATAATTSGTTTPSSTSKDLTISEMIQIIKKELDIKADTATEVIDAAAKSISKDAVEKVNKESNIKSKAKVIITAIGASNRRLAEVQEFIPNKSIAKAKPAPASAASKGSKTLEEFNPSAPVEAKAAPMKRGPDLLTLGKTVPISKVEEFDPLALKAKSTKSSTIKRAEEVKPAVLESSAPSAPLTLSDMIDKIKSEFKIESGTAEEVVSKAAAQLSQDVVTEVNNAKGIKNKASIVYAQIETTETKGSSSFLSTIYNSISSAGSQLLGSSQAIRSSGKLPTFVDLVSTQEKPAVARISHPTLSTAAKKTHSMVKAEAVQFIDAVPTSGNRKLQSDNMSEVDSNDGQEMDSFAYMLVGIIIVAVAIAFFYLRRSSVLTSTEAYTRLSQNESNGDIEFGKLSDDIDEPADEDEDDWEDDWDNNKPAVSRPDPLVPSNNSKLSVVKSKSGEFSSSSDDLKAKSPIADVPVVPPAPVSAPAPVTVPKLPKPAVSKPAPIASNDDIFATIGITAAPTFKSPVSNSSSAKASPSSATSPRTNLKDIGTGEVVSSWSDDDFDEIDK